MAVPEKTMTEAMTGKPRILEKRCAIVTGASLGLGFAIAQKYVEAGADVLICARSADSLEAAHSRLRELARPGQSVLSQCADVSNPRDVAALVERALVQFGQLHVLVNNAGIAGPAGAAEDADWHEWLRTLEVNLLGAVLLCRAVLPHFKRAAYGKIIQLSGGGATNPLPMLSAYAASKAAVVRFMETLAEETRPHHIDVNSIAPGALNTRLLDQFIAAGPDRIGAAFHARSLLQKEQGGVPLDRGAELAAFLGSAGSDGITGKLLSAVWDPWTALPEYLEDLRRTDVYTLRRIVPGDRDLSWGTVD
ncbi:MAG: family oxidoreductase [Gammaproteobacteria bacterium]|nr:family oxidoreductase [Gammaproteobacteria bacterium]